MDDRKPERESKGVRAFMWERLVRNNKLWVEPCENEDLDNGMILYHGSYTAVPEIDLTKCFPGHDLGAGFYVTSSLEMACRYAKAAVRKAVLCGTVPEKFHRKGWQDIRLPVSVEEHDFRMLYDCHQPGMVALYCGKPEQGACLG